jgi:HAE1 family hydrophobic/amphiphilic exporter-1
VFVPVSFFPGSTGILYKQFSLTIAFSIAISAFNALTLSPALSALLIHREKRHHGLLGLMARLMKDAGRWYAGTIHAVLRHKKKIAGLFVAGLAATVWIYNHVPTAFVPDEDQGYFMLQVLAPQGASLAYTSNLGKQAQEIVQQNPDVFGTFSVMGFGFSGAVPNQGIIFVPLKPQSERKGNAHSAKAIVAGIQPKLFQIPGGIVAAFEPPAVNGIGNFGGFQFELQDNGRNTLDDLARVAHTIVGSSRQDALLDGLYTGFTANDPQIKVTIDREKAKAMGVPLTQLADTLGVFMGSEYINDFDFNNRSYRVYVQAESQFRNTMRSLRQFYVRSATGQMVPLDTLIAAQESSGPQIISHYNLFRSAEILGSSSPGHSSGEGLAEMEKLAKKNMMQGMSFEWSGLALEEIESNGKMMLIFGLGIVGVYLTLSAQYESFALPFIILLAVPMAVLGALGAVSLRGLDNNIYVQIGLVLLIGLAAKNSILIVEFAEQIRATGKSIEESAILAAELRLRPILMTSFAFILGVLPLVFATGAGMVGRHSVGTAVVGGMLVSTMLNLIFIPVLYVLLKTGLERFTRRGKTLPESESGAQ